MLRITLTSDNQGEGKTALANWLMTQMKLHSHEAVYINKEYNVRAKERVGDDKGVDLDNYIHNPMNIEIIDIDAGSEQKDSADPAIDALQECRRFLDKGMAVRCVNQWPALKQLLPDLLAKIDRAIATSKEQKAKPEISFETKMDIDEMVQEFSRELEYNSSRLIAQAHARFKDELANRKSENIPAAANPLPVMLPGVELDRDVAIFAAAVRKDTDRQRTREGDRAANIAISHFRTYLAKRLGVPE